MTDNALKNIRKAEIADAFRLAEIEIFNYRLNFYPIFKTDGYFFGELSVPVLIGEYEKEYDITDFLELVKAALGAKCLEYYACRNVRKVALVGGSAAEFISDAFNAGADTFITSDIKYHDFKLAKELGINLIDAGHFNTENPVVFTLYKKLSDKFPDVEFFVSESNSSVTSFY